MKYKYQFKNVNALIIPFLEALTAIEDLLIERYRLKMCPTLPSVLFQSFWY